MTQELALVKQAATGRVSILEPNNLAELNELGTLMAQSGFFSDTRGAAQACVKILAGREMGFPPIASMVGISIINGKPATGAGLIAAGMKSRGYTWKVLQRDSKGCKIVVSYRGDELGPAEFTEEDAQRAGLLGKEVWKKYPKSLYFARCITDAARTYAPEVFAGLPPYTAEELGAEHTTEDGALIVETPAVAPIDTGGAPMGTRAAQAAVAERKIAELKKESNPKPEASASGIPEVDALWARMGSSKERIGEVVQELHDGLCEVSNKDTADEIYHSLTQQHGSPFSRISIAQKVTKDMWLAIEARRSAVLPAEPEEIDAEPEVTNA